jgi:hypothetical protein
MDLYRQNEAYLDVSPDDRKVILKLFAEADGTETLVALSDLLQAFRNLR